MSTIHNTFVHHRYIQWDHTYMHKHQLPFCIVQLSVPLTAPSFLLIIFKQNLTAFFCFKLFWGKTFIRRLLLTSGDINQDCTHSKSGKVCGVCFFSDKKSAEKVCKSRHQNFATKVRKSIKSLKMHHLKAKCIKIWHQEHVNKRFWAF